MYISDEELIKSLAEFIMFSSGVSAKAIDEKMNNLGLEFRKNKGV